MKRCYEAAFEDGDVRRSALIGKRSYIVTSSDYVPGRNWTEREQEALRKRGLAEPHPESDKSIACSLGRSVGAVRTMRHTLTSPGYVRPTGTGHARTGFGIGYRKLIRKVMASLPNQGGTLAQIHAEFEQLPEVFLAACSSRHAWECSGWFDGVGDWQAGHKHRAWSQKSNQMAEDGRQSAERTSRILTN